MSKTCRHPTCYDSEYCRRPVKEKKIYQLKRTALKQSMKSTKKKKLTPLPKLKAKAQKIFNAYIRERDSQDGFFTCISCGQTLPTDLMDAGHYVPQKGGSFLTLHEFNVNGECKKCNGFDPFHLIGYRKNLIGKIGEDAVKWLEDNRHVVYKWTRAELEDIIETYSQPKKLKSA